MKEGLVDKETNKTEPRSKLSIWVQAVRAFSFTASMVPVIVGAVLALYYEGAVRWDLLPVILVCSILYHAATNLMSDYFDHGKGVDKDYTFGSSRVIQDGLLEPKNLLFGGWLLYGIATLLGLLLIAVRGETMFWIGLIGLIGGYTYTGKPIGYKYKALGDVLVFVLMGPLMVIGSYFALTGDISQSVILISLPIGFLVTAILHANNHRDIVHDAEAGARTLAGLLGHTGSKFFYYFLILGAYISVIYMVADGTLSRWSFIVFLSLMPAFKLMRTISKNEPADTKTIAMIDVQTAQLHLLFGVLLILSLLISVFVV